MTSPATAARLPARSTRTWIGSLVILLIAIFYSGGLTLINQRVPGRVEIAAGTPIDAGRGVSFDVTSGWSAELAKTKPGETSSLSRDTSNFTLTTIDWDGSATDLVARLQHLFEGLQHLNIYDDTTPFDTTAGLEGITFSMHGEHLNGRAWIILIPETKHAIAARVRSIPGSGDDAHRDARTMIASIKVGTAP